MWLHQTPGTGFSFPPWELSHEDPIIIFKKWQVFLPGIVVSSISTQFTVLMGIFRPK
jgi:hypothetical protein